MAKGTEQILEEDLWGAQVMSAVVLDGNDVYAVQAEKTPFAPWRLASVWREREENGAVKASRVLDRETVERVGKTLQSEFFDEIESDLKFDHLIMREYPSSQAELGA